MTQPLFPSSSLKDTFAALRRDLLHDDGPRISTMRNYRFAIVQYKPSQEFALRGEVQRLGADLRRGGWYVFSISLRRLLLDRIRAEGDDWLPRVIDWERRTSERDQARGLEYLKSKLIPLIEGPGGLADECSVMIRQHVKDHPDQVDRTLVLIGRAGAVYPFFRSSALLRDLNGRTDNVPVVLLYPGTRHGISSLSYMGIVDPDNDYRPRIY